MEKIYNFLKNHPATIEAENKLQFFLNGIIKDLEESSIKIMKDGEITLFALLVDEISNFNQTAELIILGVNQASPHFEKNLEQTLIEAIKRTEIKSDKRGIEFFDEGLIPEFITILKKYDFKVDYHNYQMKCEKELTPQIETPFKENSIKWISYKEERAKQYYDHITLAFKGIKGINILPFEQSRKRLEQQKDKEFIKLLIESKTESIIGSFKVGASLEDYHYGDVKTIARNPEFRGRGIGVLLLKEAISYLKEKGFKKFSLEVNAENEKALKLYQNFGFSITKDYPSFVKALKN